MSNPFKVGDKVSTRYGIQLPECHIPAGKKGSAQIVNGPDVHVLFEGTHVNRKVPWAYLDKLEGEPPS